MDFGWFFGSLCGDGMSESIETYGRWKRNPALSFHKYMYMALHIPGDAGFRGSFINRLCF